ncbi:hypothetical protein DB88DRAFT_520194 [Papiliotrema laurentii]|uniref:BZIP domain-containing protein n=1 Tax=Papiliotrema laurentii TaxID=5418 RepID=A0AAD9FPQ2_PAPLA|nr:hypothetical protein DB88DRAFT_520194 [Papiliotrema laurentii]
MTGGIKTKSLPSPTTSSSLSPVKRPQLRNLPPIRAASDSQDEDDDYASGDEEMTKLEVRREKNRVKQRNLRLRRANHIAELEAADSTLRTELATLQAHLQDSQQRETNLTACLHDLDSVLFAHNLSAHSLSSEVNQLRRIWAHVFGPNLPTLRSSDPLATLATAASPAASASRSAGAASPEADARLSVDAIPSPTPTMHWDSQVTHPWPVLGIATEDRKRKREEEEVFRRDAPLPSAHELPSIQPFDEDTERPSSFATASDSSANPSQNIAVSPRSHDRLAVFNLLSPVNEDFVDLHPGPDPRRPGANWQGAEGVLATREPADANDKWSKGDFYVNHQSLSVLEPTSGPRTGEHSRDVYKVLTGSSLSLTCVPPYTTHSALPLAHLSPPQLVDTSNPRVKRSPRSPRQYSPMITLPSPTPSLKYFKRSPKSPTISLPPIHLSSLHLRSLSI